MARLPNRLTRRDALALATLAVMLGVVTTFAIHMIGMPDQSLRDSLPLARASGVGWSDHWSFWQAVMRDLATAGAR